MKIVAVTIFLLGLASYVSAQTLNVNGATLSLGESEAKARRDIAVAGITIQQMSGSPSYLLSIKHGDLHEPLGGVSFKDEKVEWIERDWYLERTSDDKNILAQIFYSAATSLLEGNDSSICVVSTESHDDSPHSGTAKVTTIECHRGSYIHTLSLIGVDCSGGCSIGTITASLSESIKAKIGD